MRNLLVIGASVLVCACAGDPQLHSSFTTNGMSAPAMDPRNPHFYMDEGEIAPVLSNPPRLQQRAPGDPMCASNCQSSGNTMEYCTRACGL